MKWCSRCAALVLLWPAWSAAHGFDERYDLPAPLSYFVWGACATVGLSFLVMALFARASPQADALLPQTGQWSLQLGAWAKPLALIVRLLALALFVLAVASALYGTGDPLVNLAPTLVWIVAWLGLALLAGFVVDVWPLLDPWRTVYDALDTLLRRLGVTQGLNLGWRWPAWLGCWPAVLLLLLWGWLEMVFPIAAVPWQLGTMLCLWTLINLAGMVCSGREVWQRHADLFSVYYATLGRLAPLAWDENRKTLHLRWPGAGLLQGPSELAGGVAFVMAMLSTVLFDGMHGGEAWYVLDSLLHHYFARWMDINGYVPGTIGLLGVWLFFLLAYGASCFITSRLTRQGTMADTARRFALTLVPIAAAYVLAHNFSSLLIQGQNVIAMLSDPLGRQWNLFGTAGHYANIGLIDARTTWYVAIGAIVAGHVLSVWLAHRIALREYTTQRQAVVATLPLTVLMVFYTGISLSVMAEPMVNFQGQVEDQPTRAPGAMMGGAALSASMAKPAACL